MSLIRSKWPQCEQRACRNRPAPGCGDRGGAIASEHNWPPTAPSHSAAVQIHVRSHDCATAAALKWSPTEILATVPTAPSYPFPTHVTVVVDRQQASGDLAQRRLPGHLLKAPAALGPDPALGMEQAVRAVDAVQVALDLGAEAAAGERVVGIAAQVDRAAVLHRRQPGARIGAVVGAAAADDRPCHRNIMPISIY